VSDRTDAPRDPLRFPTRRHRELKFWRAWRLVELGAGLYLLTALGYFGVALFGGSAFVPSRLPLTTSTLVAPGLPVSIGPTSTT
jgi:hypothetical protein